MDAARGKTATEKKETRGTRVKVERLQEEKIYVLHEYMKTCLKIDYSPKKIDTKWRSSKKKRCGNCSHWKRQTMCDYFDK